MIIVYYETCIETLSTLTPLLGMAPSWGHNDMHVQFLWPYQGAMIYSLIQHGQIVCNSIQLSSIITTDISVDFTTC